MKACKRILSIDCVFSEEVLGEEGMLFNSENLSGKFHEGLLTQERSKYLRSRVINNYN